MDTKKGILRPPISQTHWPSDQGKSSLVSGIIWASVILLVPIPCLFCYIDSLFLPDELLFDLSRCWKDKTQVPQWRMWVH